MTEAGGARATGQAAPDAGWVRLDAPKLARFIAYEQRLKEADERMAKKAQAFESKRDAGWERDAATLNEALAVVQGQAEARRKALQESGLGQNEVDFAEQLMADVMGRRLASGGNSDALIEHLEEAMSHVPPEQQSQFEEALAHTRSAKEAGRALVPERQRYGDANVDLVLAHEEELRRLMRQ